MVWIYLLISPSYGYEYECEEGKCYECEAKSCVHRVANRTKEVRLRKRTLVIRMDSGVMKEEFSYNKGKIADMLNEKLGVNAIDTVEIW